MNKGDAVAVLEIGARSPFESMSIATIGTADQNRVKLSDGREYQQFGNQWVNEDESAHIVPATQWHISVVHKRCLRPISAQR